MNIIKYNKSSEVCNEINWHAYDVFFDDIIDESFILNLKFFGKLIYLKNLNNPFFKINTNEYIIKGTQNDTKLRIAIYNNDSYILNFILENII